MAMAAPSRLSPAANLLRNSKLFALPAAIPLPPSTPSAEPKAGSDTATTIYPTRAAIVTPQIALARGDWGFKRALPLKSTTNTSTPTVRLTKDIDSSGHVTDFESAADHVQTHAKWQDVYVQLKNRPSWASSRTSRHDGRQLSVFHPQLDNTTVKGRTPTSTHDLETHTPEHLRAPLEQLRLDREAAAKSNGQILPPPPTAPQPKVMQAKRWRYDGPWLAGMTELEFEAYLGHLDKEQIAGFQSHLKSRIIANKEAERMKDLETRGASAQDLPPIQVTDDDIKNALRTLRQHPSSFGPQIAEFLDLADGPTSDLVSLPGRSTRQRAWAYRADGSPSTVASSSYQDVGPPRTHPSAGFSYIRSDRLSKNSPQYGPQLPQYYLPARVLKDRTAREDKQTQGAQAHGVGGFVSRPSPHSYGKTNVGIGDSWTPQKGGTKFVAHLTEMSVAQDGSMELEADRLHSWYLTDNVPVSRQELSDRRTQAALKNAPARMERLPSLDETPMQRERRDVSTPSESSADILKELDATFKARKR